MPKAERVLAVPASGEISIGTRLRALRWFRGLTAAELGLAAGQSQGGPFDRSHVSHVELGRVRPSEQFVTGAAEALGTTQEELLGASPQQVRAWMAVGPPRRSRPARTSRGRRGRRVAVPGAEGEAGDESVSGAPVTSGLYVDLTRLHSVLAELPPGLQQRCVGALIPIVEAVRDAALGS